MESIIRFIYEANGIYVDHLTTIELWENIVILATLLAPVILLVSIMIFKILTRDWEWFKGACSTKECVNVKHNPDENWEFGKLEDYDPNVTIDKQ